jgi:hypothetical protein
MLKAWLLASALLAQHADPSACAVIEADELRLRCYDAHFRTPPLESREDLPRDEKVVERAPVEPAPVLPTPVASPPVRAPEEEFGLTPAQLAERDRGASSVPVLEQLEARVSSVARTGSGHFVITLDNGQRWTEVAPSERVRFRQGDAVTIRRASLGSFLARGPGSGGSVRVRRTD